MEARAHLAFVSHFRCYVCLCKPCAYHYCLMIDKGQGRGQGRVDLHPKKRKKERKKRGSWGYLFILLYTSYMSSFRAFTSRDWNECKTHVKPGLDIVVLIMRLCILLKTVFKLNT